MIAVVTLAAVLSHPWYMGCGFIRKDPYGDGRITPESKSVMWGDDKWYDDADINITVKYANGTNAYIYELGKTHTIHVVDKKEYPDSFDDVTHGNISLSHGSGTADDNDCNITRWNTKHERTRTYDWTAPSYAANVTITHFTASFPGNAVMKQITIGVVPEAYRSTNGTKTSVSWPTQAELSRILYIPFMLSMLFLAELAWPWQQRTGWKKVFRCYAVLYIISIIIFATRDGTYTTPSFQDTNWLGFVLWGAVLLVGIFLMIWYKRDTNVIIDFIYFTLWLCITVLPMSHLWHIKYGEQPNMRWRVFITWAFTNCAVVCVSYLFSNNTSSTDNLFTRLKNALESLQGGGRFALVAYVVYIIGFAIVAEHGEWEAVYEGELALTLLSIVLFIYKQHTTMWDKIRGSGNDNVAPQPPTNTVDTGASDALRPNPLLF